jgi:hypothetical protein
MIKGITVQLLDKVETGKDPFGQSTFEEKVIDVENVLIGEPSTQDIINELNLTGKKLVYTLAIPKGDDHDWTDKKVRFFGQTFQTFGEVTQGIEANIPLAWTKKVKVERYG